MKRSRNRDGDNERQRKMLVRCGGSSRPMIAVTNVCELGLKRHKCHSLLIEYKAVQDGSRQRPGDADDRDDSLTVS